MLSALVKTLLLLTSFSPVLLTYIFILITSKDPNIVKIFILFLITITLTLLSFFIINKAKKKLEILNFPIKSVKTADGEIFSFIIVYLLPFVSLTSNKVNESILLFIIFLFILIAWSTNSYHINPVLSLIGGYHFYEVTTEEDITFLLMTKNTLRNTKSIKEVVQLTEYMVLDISKER